MSSGKPDVFAVVSKDDVREEILKRRRLNPSTSTAASTIPAASVSAGAAASISAAAAPLPSPPASDATRPTPQSKGYQRIENAQYPAIQHGYHQKHKLIRYEVPLEKGFACDLCGQRCGRHTPSAQTLKQHPDAKGAGPDVDAATLDTFDASERATASEQFTVIYLCDRQCCGDAKGNYLFGLCVRCAHRDVGGLAIVFDNEEFKVELPQGHQPDHVLYSSFVSEKSKDPVEPGLELPPPFQCSHCHKVGKPHRTYFYSCYQDAACCSLHICGSCYKKETDFGLRKKLMKPPELKSPPVGSNADAEYDKTNEARMKSQNTSRAWSEHGSEGFWTEQLLTSSFSLVLCCSPLCLQSVSPR